MKPETKRKRLGDYNVRVWQEGDERNATTWPVPAGEFWSQIRDKLWRSVYRDRDVVLTRQEAMAIQALMGGYRSLLQNQPKWRTKALREAMEEMLNEEAPW